MTSFYTGDASQPELDGDSQFGNLPITGPRGPKGNDGPIGATGPAGRQGEQGVRGDQGPIGPRGQTGSQGDEGPIGPQGDRGDQGPKGDKGDVGATGQKGDQGQTGAKGDKGDTGLTGPKGDQGLTGPRGDTGLTGAKGDKGDQGIKGDVGLTGPKGDQGERGLTGDQGVKGDQGIKGDKGDAGSVGPQGERGLPGEKGAAVTGPKGDAGPVGPAGGTAQTGDIRSLVRNAPKAGFLPLDGGVYLKSAYPALAAYVGDYGNSGTDSFNKRNAISGNPATTSTYFKGSYVFGTAGTTLNRSTSAANGSWLSWSWPSSTSANALAARGDDSIMMASNGSSTLYTVTALGAAPTVLSNRYTLYAGGTTGDQFLRILAHPTNTGLFLICGSNGTAGNQALLLGTADGTAITRYTMAPTSASVRDVTWFPAAALWIAAMSDGTIQTAPALDGVWTIRNSGNTQLLERIVIVGNTAYFLGTGGRMVIMPGDAPTQLMSTLINGGISTIVDAVRIGDVTFILASSNVLDGRARVLVSYDMTKTDYRIYDDGSFPSAPKALVVAAGRIVFFESTSPVVSQALDLNPMTQFVVPTFNSNNGAVTNYIKT